MIQGWNGNNPIFGELIQEVNPKVIIEVGSWKGQSAVNMAKQTNATIYCVDTWLGSSEMYTNPNKDRDLKLVDGYPTIYKEFRANTKQYKNIIPIPLDSLSAAEVLESKAVKADLIYIDAGHSYKAVANDISYFVTLLSSKGIMFGDDYDNPEFPGVKQAVTEWFSNHTEQSGFWIYRH